MKSIIFPAELEDAIARRAKEQERSFTGQVVYMLRDYLTTQYDIKQRVERVESTILEIGEELRRR